MERLSINLENDKIMIKKQPSEEQLFKVLETIVNSQLLVENLEDLKDITMYNRLKVKHLTNQLIKELANIAEKDYNAIFGIDQQLTLNISYEYDKLIKMIARKNIPEKVELSQICEAYALDRQSMEANTHRILRKHQRTI